MAIAAAKMGVDLAVATPEDMRSHLRCSRLSSKPEQGVKSPGKLIQTNVPEEAVKDCADPSHGYMGICMGQEEKQSNE